MVITAEVPQLVHSRVLLTLSERPWRYLATALAALASDLWLEKPFIRLGHRFAPPATPGHRDLEAGVPAPVPMPPKGTFGPLQA